jgi:DNA polymerase III alpha subunit
MDDRFLKPDSVSMPDFDDEFSQDSRDDVIS